MAVRSENEISQAFHARKNAILSALAEPESTYNDASPKGSVDQAIKPLIAKINGLPGAVTTSSCAGRMSVFLEGSRQQNESPEQAQGQSDGQKAVAGGQGNGGRWLYVSHEPVGRDESSCEQDVRVLLGLSASTSPTSEAAINVHTARWIRFQFEPMILHVMMASLQHAQPILAAAINSGFRESGVHSLKNLHDPLALPMVAVRTSGLAFSSIIGYSLGPGDANDTVHMLVNDDYLNILLQIASERFEANTQRMQRFEREIDRQHRQSPVSFQDSASRAQMKRREGLARQAAVLSDKTDAETQHEVDDDLCLDAIAMDDG